MTWFHFDAEGRQLGKATSEDVALPGEAGRTEVAPVDVRQVWLGDRWSPPPPPEPDPIDAEELWDVLEAKGVVGSSDRPRPKPPARAG